ncbi:MAG: hypothetical protein MPK62_11240, partial [Alphaproteobacteria bacterium]|nr:hypothetical protein [Alphaproteobacteria bacterium]
MYKRQVFSITSLPGGDTLTDWVEVQGGNSAPLLPAGVDLHWNTITPKGTADRTGGTDSFRVPAPASGQSLPVVISVAAGTASGIHTLSLGANSETTLFTTNGGTDGEISSPAQFQLFVTGSDVPTVQFSSSDVAGVAVIEANSNVQLTLNIVPQFASSVDEEDRTLRVNIRPDEDPDTDDANLGDYSDVDDFVLPVSASSATLNIPLLDDRIVEESETFVVEISRNAAGYQVGDNDAVVVTIEDNEVLAPKTIFMVNTPGEPRTWPYVHPYEFMTSGSTATQAVTLWLTEDAPTGGLTVPIAYSATGIASGDQVASSAVTVPANVTIAAGERTGTANIVVTPGSLANKRFKVEIGTPPTGWSAATDADEVEFVVGAATSVPSGADVAFYPSTLTIEQGGSDTFQVVHLPTADASPGTAF